MGCRWSFLCAPDPSEARQPLIRGDATGLAARFISVTRRLLGVRPASSSTASPSQTLADPAPLPPPLEPPSEGDDATEQVVWVSLDPARGTLQNYPRRIAEKIESAFQDGQPAVETGFFGATICFNDGGRDMHIQRTSNGRRDVRRIAVQTAPIFLQIHRPGHAWHIVKQSSSDDETREVQLHPGDDAVELSAMSSSRPTASAAGGNWVGWIALNPRNGNIDAYPREIATILERAWKQGTRSVDLGQSFFNATVELRDGAFSQRTARGHRDVKRVELDSATAPVVAHVIQGGRTWHFAASAEMPGAEERTAVLEDAVLELSQLATTDSEPSNSQPVDNAGAAPSRPSQQMALWEWCRELRQSADSSNLLGERSWGVYSEEDNDAIERAFQAGEAYADICIGIRQYQIIFGPEPGFARQEDSAFRKRRLVRRREVTSQEFRRKFLQAVPANTTRGQDECIICLLPFAETAQMPVIELQECKHVFHQACVQPMADSRERCPCCRRDVNWLNASVLQAS